jgi:hypothetical protein
MFSNLKINDGLFESDYNQLTTIFNEADNGIMTSMGKFEYAYLGESVAQPAEDGEAARKSLMQRFIEFIKKLIEKIKQWFDEKFKLTEKAFGSNIKYLASYVGPNGETYKSIEVTTVQNINSLSKVISKLEEAKKELIQKGLLELPQTILSQSKIKIGYDVLKILRGKYLNGYLDIYKEYNGKSHEEIRDSEFGKVGPLKNIDITKFLSYYNLTKQFKNQLDQYASDYGSVLNKISLAFNTADAFGMSSVEGNILYSKIMQIANHYFSININLITKITIDVLTITLHTTNQMVSKAKEAK